MLKIAVNFTELCRMMAGRKKRFSRNSATGILGQGVSLLHAAEYSPDRYTKQLVARCYSAVFCARQKETQAGSLMGDILADTSFRCTQEAGTTVMN
jgi:hypothetical protein